MRLEKRRKRLIMLMRTKVVDNRFALGFGHDHKTPDASLVRKTKRSSGVFVFVRSFMLADSPIWEFLESWETPNCYSNQFAYLPNGPGVYLLVLATIRDGILDHQILYVGMSRNVAKRLKGHEVKRLCERDFRGDFIKVYFKRCPEPFLRLREQKLIERFNPPYNLQHRRRGV